MNTEWTKSSHSGKQGNCVAVAVDGDGDTVFVKHSREQSGTRILAFTAQEWDAFVAGVKNGEFDL